MIPQVFAVSAVQEKAHRAQKRHLMKTGVSKRHLEIFLQKVPEMAVVSPKREQYKTPATLAADMLFAAHALGALRGRSVLDLGCGTGILGLGAALLGATRVVAVDIEPILLAQGRKFAEKHQLDVEFLCADVRELELRGLENAVTIQNPPFGAQKSNRMGDRAFLELAFAHSSEVFSLHLAKTKPFLEKLGVACGFTLELLTIYDFPLKHQFSFHRKTKSSIQVGLFHFLPVEPKGQGE